MADCVLQARPALGLALQPGHHGDMAGGAGVIIGEHTIPGIVSVMARKGQTDALSEAAKAVFGAALPSTPRRVVGQGIAFLWSGPDRWLAVASERHSEALAVDLAKAFGDLASLTAQGDGRAVIWIGGARAREVLAKMVGIDLHPRSFRVDDTAITGAAHVEVQIWQIDDRPSYEIALFRSFAGSFLRGLEQAAAEYGYQILGSA